MQMPANCEPIRLNSEKDDATRGSWVS